MSEILDTFEDVIDDVKTFLTENPKPSAIAGLAFGILMVIAGCSGSIVKLALWLGGMFLCRWACRILWPKNFKEPGDE